MSTHLFDAPFSCFVTGTDTEIGKTLISSAVVHLQAQKGFKVAGMKPVAAGAVFQEHPDKRWFNEDVHSLMNASSVYLPQDTVCPYLFKTPVAPHLAAEQEGVNIDPNVILQAYEKLRSLTQAVVVEGVGGFRVPLTRTFDTADLASMLELPVILVVGMRLGCINHALLSAESIRARGLNLVGWVANSMGQPMNKLEENIQAIDQRIGAKKLAYVPYLRNASAEAAAPYFGHPDLSVLPGDF